VLLITKTGHRIMPRFITKKNHRPQVTGAVQAATTSSPTKGEKGKPPPPNPPSTIEKKKKMGGGEQGSTSLQQCDVLHREGRKNPTGFMLEPGGRKKEKRGKCADDVFHTTMPSSERKRRLVQKSPA